MPISVSYGIWYDLKSPIKGLIKLQNPCKYFEDCSFGFHFRDLQKLTQQSY